MPEKSAPSSPIRFGPFELSFETQELRKHGLPVKLSGQAIQVLLVLTAFPGKLVTREELQHKLWQGAGFGDFDHGLNAAVNKLREKLGDSATTPKYVETLPGRGYRFIATLEPSAELHERTVDAPTTWPPKSTGQDLPSTSPKLRPWKHKAAIAVAACIVMAGSLYPWIMPKIDRLLRSYELQRLTVVPLTSLPGHVWSPTFSPDGSQVAFGWSENEAHKREIYLKVIGNEKPLRLTYSPPGTYGAGNSAWSPDGRNIAFVRKEDDDASSGVFLINALGGPERKLTSACCFLSFGVALSWSPDGKQLAFLDHTANKEGALLFVLSLESMERRLIQTGCDTVATPSFSPRGHYLAWACIHNWTNISINFERLSDGRVTQLLRRTSSIGGLGWSADESRIVFTDNFLGGDIWEVALVDPDHPEKLPVGHDASQLSVSPVGNRLAFVQLHRNVNIWRLDLSDPTPRAQKIVTSSRVQLDPRYSPDGSQIAFTSDRSGKWEIWMSEADGTNPVQLSAFGSESTGAPSWSPDGKLIAFDSRTEGESNIYFVDPHVGVPRKLNIDVHGNNFPRWSLDGAWIYFENGEDARHPTIWKVPSSGGHALQIAKHPATRPIESPDGQHVYFFRNDHFWVVKNDGTDEQQVEGMPPVEEDRLVPCAAGIYFFDNRTLSFFNFSTKKTRRVYDMEKSPPMYTGGISVSPDGRFLLFPQLDDGGRDLMMIENWH